MREIKFKAWDTATKRFYELVETRVPELNCGEDDGVVYLQYTGLKDKNGKEIYEGDIVTSQSWRGDNIYWVVEWTKNEDDACFALAGFGKNTIDKEGYLWLGCAKEMEVIGNIYENPELLK